MNYVPVLDTNRKPLAPCHPARARELLRKGKAAVFRKTPFTIILNYVPQTETNTNFDIRIDPGSKTTGIAVVSHGKRGSRCVYGVNLKHRGHQISDDLRKRAGCRRTRRARKTRYRQPRFLNRTKPKGWLAPSVKHRELTTCTWIDRLMHSMPITSSRVEEVSFDTQKLQNPKIQGKDYQRGKLFDTEMREYLLYTHNHTCQYCRGASGDKILEREHMTPRSRGGSDALYNAALVCRRCNQLKGDKTLPEFIKAVQGSNIKHFKALQKYLPLVDHKHRWSLKDAAVMNAVRHRVFHYLEALGLKPTYYSGWKTKRNRIDQGYNKDHWVDAACIGDADEKVYISPRHHCLTIACKGHGSRQMCRVNKHGFPRTSPKGNSRVFGFKTGDLGLAKVPHGKYRGVHRGRVAVRSSGQFTLNKHDIQVKHIAKLFSTDGYEYTDRCKQTRIIFVGEDDSLELQFSLIKKIMSKTKIRNGYMYHVV